MSLRREGPKRHGCRHEPAHDAINRFHLLQRNRIALLEPEEIAYLGRGTVLDRFDVRVPVSLVTRPYGPLQCEDDLGRGHMVRPTAPLLVEAAHMLLTLGIPGVELQSTLGDLTESNTGHPGRRESEGEPADILIETDRFEQLASPVGRHRADAHLRQDLQEARLQCRSVVLLRHHRIDVHHP